MIYIYFFINSLINLSRNSVRFENSSGNWLSDRLNSVRFYLTVWGMASMVDLDEVAHSEPPHQDLRCMQFPLFVSLVLKELSITHSSHLLEA